MEFSEYVSLGHPDKVADYISSFLLDRYIEQDPNTRYAVEVQIKDNHVCLGGEVTSKASFSDDEIKAFVSEAIYEIGYTPAYAKKWGYENTISSDNIDVVAVNINQQSPDISQGVDIGGWGDQGIFFGMATPDSTYEYMPQDHALAKNICKKLFESGIGGLDIKSEVIMQGEEIKQVIVAIPLLKDSHDENDKVRAVIKSIMGDCCDIVVNGTGVFKQHGSVADCGTTGRKLAVDFYGGNCRIGGGSPWTKDGSKADLTLNAYARKLAKFYAKETGETVYAELACCIGRKDVFFEVKTVNGRIICSGISKHNSNELRQQLGFDKPIYASMCRWGLFGQWQKDKEWEKTNNNSICN